MNDEGRPVPVIVDSWREENPLGAFSNEAGPSMSDAGSTGVTTAGAKKVRRRSIGTVLGIVALGALSVSVTALLNSAIAPSTAVPQPAPVSRALASSRPPSQVGSAGQSPQTAVSIESGELPASVQNRGVHEVPPPMALSRAVSAVQAGGDSGQALQVPNTKEREPSAREAVDAVPQPIAEAPIGALAFGEPAPIVVAPPKVADAPAIADPSTSPADPALGRPAVAAVLQRYARAFSSLDVGEVKAVWPDVNEGALARAFSTLQDQRFDLGECDIWVTGASAVASCAGRASYTPKIGNRKPRWETREWTFYLHQDGLQWSIGTVRTR